MLEKPMKYLVEKTDGSLGLMQLAEGFSIDEEIEKLGSEYTGVYIEAPESLPARAENLKLVDGEIIVDSAKAVKTNNAKARIDRESAYKAEADPLLFKCQRGEIEKQVWLDKIEEIKNRYPYIGE